MIFIDTSAFVAYFHLKDKHYQEVMKFFEKIRQERLKIATSDYVIDETITTIFARTKLFETARKFGETIILSQITEKLWVSQEDFQMAWNIFKKEGSLGLSFTDCTSIAIMRRLRITKIFTFDEHFRLMGFEIVP